MASSMTNLVMLVVLSISLHGGISCRYYCRNPVTSVYDCCDDGNPYTTTTNKPADTNDNNTTDSDGASQNTTTDQTSVDSNASSDEVVLPPATITVVEHGPENGAKYNESSGCRYYCAYGNNVYCCDNGTLTMPDDHDANHGRCPSILEQVCKDDAIYLDRKARKMETTVSGSDFLSKLGEGEVMCASDGYCEDDERCCSSPCHKRHVCMKSVVLNKAKN